MPSRLERKALRAVTDKGSQDFSQSSNKPGLEDNLMATREARMLFPVNDG